MAIIGSPHEKSRSYTFPRWYVAGPSGVQPRVIQSTNSEELEFVEDVEGFSISERYAVNAKVADTQNFSKATNQENDGTSGKLCPTEPAYNVIIPTPLIFERNGDKIVSFNKTWRIVYEENLTDEATYLSGLFLDIICYN